MKSSLVFLFSFLALGACAPQMTLSSDASTQDVPNADVQSADVASSTDSPTPPPSDAPATMGRMSSIPVGSCFSFARGTFDMANPCVNGEIYTLAGINVDISSGGNSDTLCHLNGPFAALADVPTSYAACMWTRYVEGADPLNNHGLIIRDATGMHHYRARIVSNNPNLVLEWDVID